MGLAQVVGEHLRGRGIEAVAFEADLGEESAVRDLVRGAQHRFGRLDALNRLEKHIRLMKRQPEQLLRLSRTSLPSH